MPDEVAGEASYPWKFRFSLLGEHSSIPLRAGDALYERGRERAAEIGEMAGDLMAEARAEYEAEQAAAGASADATGETEVVRLHRGNGRSTMRTSSTWSKLSCRNRS